MPQALNKFEITVLQKKNYPCEIFAVKNIFLAKYLRF